MTINLHLYPSAFTNETRILRITRSLAESGIFKSIYIVASLRSPGSAELENLDPVRTVWRVRTVSKRRSLIEKAINMFEWSLSVLGAYRSKQIDCINAHSLSVLPVSVLLKLVTGSRLVYDAHEIETETTEMKGLRKGLSRLVERIFIRFVDVISLTSHGHATWYQKKYPFSKVWVIRNHPYTSMSFLTEDEKKDSELHKHCNIKNGDLLYIYQGAIARPRGTDLLMNIFSRLPSNRHIVFMGFGSDLSRLMSFVDRYTNIHHFPAVSPDRVRSYTSTADAGIHMMDDSCINHLYALPNKPLEYLNAGIPAIVSDLPEMGNLIRESGAGWVVPPGGEDALEKLILSLGIAEIAEKASFARVWACNNSWELEEKKLIEMYNSLGFNGI